MKIRDVIKKRGNTLSFEIFPPKGEFDVSVVRSLLAELSPLAPSYVSVTYSAGGSKNDALTEEIAYMAQSDYHMPSCCHVTVINSEKSEVKRVVDSFAARGIENVLALRGDRIEDLAVKDGYSHPTEIMPYLVEKGFCVGASCYPEGHPSSPCLDEDVKYMKKKEELGASYFVSQLCFDNRRFKEFFDRVDKAGIESPVCAGIMPIMSKAQVNRMIYMCAVSLPGEIIRILNRYEFDKEGLLSAGLDYAAKQVAELFDMGVDDIHFYTMNRPEVARGLVERLKALGYLK